jgi:ketol-acid reductoisomerase
VTPKLVGPSSVELSAANLSDAQRIAILRRVTTPLDPLPAPAPPPMRVLRGDGEAPLDPLRDRRVALLGFGNQGRAHALNLRESGISVLVGGRPDGAGGRGQREARGLGFEVANYAEAAAEGDLIILALPDEAHAGVYAASIADHARPGVTLGFLHGFSVRYGTVKPRADLGVILVAPKGPGTTLRERYAMGQGIPALVAVERESPAGDARHLALAWANGIGSARAGILETTFAHETETDLFGEQTVLCGGLMGLVVAAFETLVARGYPPELAYIECCHEVKQVADLVYTRGLAGMRAAISNTAEFGAFTAAPRVVDEGVRRTFASILDEIRDGSFARRLLEDHASGDAWFAAERQRADRHPIELTGERVRALMPWLNGETPASRPNASAE